MNRPESIARLANGDQWDIAIVGGGATGLSAALDAATRGYKVALIERDDFAQATSSRSTKLIHGGVRYLRQGRIGLVRSALLERTRLLHNAPDLVHTRDFIIPVYSAIEKLYYGIGLKAYDLLTRRDLKPSRILSQKEAIAAMPGLKQKGLAGGVCYSDGQFDDAALAIALAEAATRHSAALANYVEATRLLKVSGRVCGIEARDVETGATIRIDARVVINATGAFSDEIRRLDEPSANGIIVPSQGAHLVLPREFFPGNAALLVPKTSDGRVLFAVPWMDRVLIGTTDVPLDAPTRAPVPLAEEIDFLLEHAAQYLARAPTRADVLSCFAGIRPLAKSGGGSTSALSRDHVIVISTSGLISIAGGKWTTCRHMAEDVINRASALAGLATRPCITSSLQIDPVVPTLNRSDAPEPLLHAALPYHDSDVIHAARSTMARSVEDILSRRSRALYLDARASAATAPRVAALLARELGRTPAWESDQVRKFQSLADQHILK